MDNDSVSEEVDEWQLIPSSSSSSNNAQWITKNETPLIKDNFYSEFAVFTPIYHQDLSMSTSQETQLQESSSKQPIFSRLNGSDESESKINKADEDDGVENEDRNKRGVVVEKWRCKLVKFFSMAKRAKWCFSGFAIAGVVSMAVVSLWCMKVGRWMKSLQRERVEHFRLLIRERDQKINQLLLQIAQMNETLSARSNVPVIRVL